MKYKHLKKRKNKLQKMASSSSLGKNLKPKQKQMDILAKYMCIYPDLAEGNLNPTYSKYFWNRILVTLNLEGPPIRNLVGWKKAWTNYKNKIKAKLTENKTRISATGAGPSKFCSFTPLEMKVISQFKLDEPVDEIPSANAIGDFKNNIGIVPLSIQETEAESSDENSREPEGRKRENFLEKQLQNQNDYQKKSLLVLTKISDSLQYIGRYERKNVELKEKLYNLAKDKFSHKQKTDMEKTKIKIEKLQMKRAMLQSRRIYKPSF